MAKKTARGTRGKIVGAAWKLFYEQGYEDTTVEEIIELSHTSKGSFYHYFDGKDALLSTLSLLFDEKYEELTDILAEKPEMTAMDRLLFLNSELFGMIENSISMDLLARLLSTQHGQDSGELSSGSSVSEMVKLYALSERAILYDWCLCGGEYPLRRYSVSVMPGFLSSFLEHREGAL